jgi:hypothetical protein
MGFLDHSTNNIIIDAVLTDKGRQLLSDNQGRFEISFFSLGDDEVDYSIIQKFGRAVGAEKISKNTPVFEAQTRDSLALKYRLLTLPDPTITRLPNLQITSDIGATSIQITGGGIAGSNVPKEVTFKQKIEGTTKIPAGLGDITFTVIIPNRFAVIDAAAPISIDTSYTSRLAYYELTAGQDPTTGGGTVTFQINPQVDLDQTIFTLYGDAGTNKDRITTQFSVIGGQSGIRKDMTLVILKG